MRTLIIFSSCFLFAFLTGDSGNLYADGKVRIIHPVRNVQSTTLITDLPTCLGEDVPDENTVPMPPSVTAVVPPNLVVVPNKDEPQPAPARLFYAGQQQAVIAWNGKTDEHGEEVLVISSLEKSATKNTEAVVSIIPLPGKPISLERGDEKMPPQIKSLLNTKIREQQQKAGKDSGHAVSPNSFIPKETACHTAFALEFSNYEHFVDDLTCFVQGYFLKEQIVLEISPDHLNVIKKYWDNGFRYFVFDISPLMAESAAKQPLVIRFQSRSVYYPLAISAIGGTGSGLVDLMVLTPGQINLRGAFDKGKEQGEVFVLGNTSVDFTLDEVKKLAPALTDVFGDLNSVKVRNFMFRTKDIGKDFTEDFIAVPIVSDKDVPKKSDRENESNGTH